MRNNSPVGFKDTLRCWIYMIFYLKLCEEYILKDTGTPTMCFLCLQCALSLPLHFWSYLSPSPALSFPQAAPSNPHVLTKVAAFFHTSSINSNSFSILPVFLCCQSQYFFPIPHLPSISNLLTVLFLVASHSNFPLCIWISFLNPFWIRCH